MDTLIFLVSAAVFVTFGYGVFWTVRAVHRVGLRRFAGALRVLVWAMLVAMSRLLQRDKNNGIGEKVGRSEGIIDAVNDLKFAEEALHRSLTGTITPDPPDAWTDPNNV